MMYESGPESMAVRERARRRLAAFRDLHRTYLAIVAGEDVLHLLEFERPDEERMMAQTIPAFVKANGSHSVIVSAPSDRDGREGAVVALMERTIETFYVPIVRFTNAAPLIGDFRPAELPDAARYRPIIAEVTRNWALRDDR